MDKYVFCPTTSLPWLKAVRGTNETYDLPDWPQLVGAKLIASYQARLGLWLLCQHWNLSPGDEILLPSYNCGTEVSPFLSYGLKVAFYRVDANACVDLTDIKSRCGAKTRVVYVTHYFGWPQDMRPIVEWCKTRGIRVVEDCALSLFSRGADGFLGTMTDAAVFSFRKTLSVPDGGVLVLRGEEASIMDVVLHAPPWSVRLKNLLPFAKTSVLGLSDTVGLYSHLRKRKLRRFRPDSIPEDCSFPDMPSDYYFNKKMRNWSISPTSTIILSLVDPAEVVTQRRRNYLCLLEAVNDISEVRPLFDSLPEGVCPLGMVVLVSHRCAITKALNAHGIAAFSWWKGYHRGFDWKEFPDACHLKDHALLLPVSQTMDERHMVFIAQCLRRIVKEVFSAAG